MNAVDSNVFIDALDNNEPAKQAKACELLDQLVLPATETRLLWQDFGGEELDEPFGRLRSLAYE